MLGSIIDCVNEGVKPPKRMMLESFRHPSFPPLHKQLLLGKFWKYVSEANKNYYAQMLGNQPEHATASDIEREFPAEWKNYKKLCIVRNPWDRMVSEYYWGGSRGKKLSFDEFLASYSASNGHQRNIYGWDIYTIDNVPVVDKIIRYENLQEELPTALTTIGVEWDGWLPFAKAASRPRERRDFRDFYNDQSAEEVRKLNCHEIEYFGYKFS